MLEDTLLLRGGISGQALSDGGCVESGDGDGLVASVFARDQGDGGGGDAEGLAEEPQQSPVGLAFDRRGLQADTQAVAM